MPVKNFICEFQSPRTWEDLEPTSKTDLWNYTEMKCYDTNLELIQNTETGAEFYIQKNIDYGDSIIIFFLLLFAIFGIVKIIADFFIPKKMDFKR